MPTPLFDHTKQQLKHDLLNRNWIEDPPEWAINPEDADELSPSDGPRQRVEDLVEQIRAKNVTRMRRLAEQRLPLFSRPRRKETY